MMNKIVVKYHNVVVGTIVEHKQGKIYFEYDDNWIKNGFSISPILLPLRKELFEAKTHYFEGLHGVFGDSIPDSWGKFLFNKYLKKHNLTDINVIDKLSYIGNSGMGALEYYPIKDSFDINSNDVDFDVIQNEINLLLDEHEVDNIDDLFHLGSSSGGTRPKILIKLDNEDYIVKFKSRYDSSDISKEEYNYSLIAKSLGINVPDVKLINTKKGTYFAIKRFDRENNNKVHMISVSALLECDFESPCLDYRDLFKVTKYISPVKSDVIELYRRMVFNVIFENLDDHAKNFAFIYNEDKKRYELSPSFDLTRGRTYFNEHTTSVNGKGKDISDDDMLLLAKENGINLSLAKEIIKNTKDKHLEYLKNIKVSIPTKI